MAGPILPNVGRLPSSWSAILTTVVLWISARSCIRSWDSCQPKPLAIFCFAVEEMEAWLLGDHIALKAAYPNANERALVAYVQDSICGTWERLADAIYPGGSGALDHLGYQQIGRKKSEWAKRIGFRMDAERNQSPSFRYFRDRLRALASG